ncbi:MAG: membrane fusion protein (multidrug efflux system) [Janthinobacterium sp.]|jgi:membrane fusion protein (multidrug efflux system)
MLRNILLALVLGAAVAACSKDAAPPVPVSSVQLLTAPEDWLTIRTNALASGVFITGSVQPERRADLRAEVAAVVLQVLKENGQSVKRGDILLRLDETALRESMNAAEQATSAASLTHDQAERMLQRLGTLRASGMVSTQALEDAQMRRNTAQSELAAARTRVAQARQQLQRTVVRAPFDGVVSERKVSNGDTAQIGKELIKVIDLASMRFEGLVSADSIAQVKLEQPVRFRINGYPEQEFFGRVARIAPTANAVTRQVEVLVEFVDKVEPRKVGPRVAGLYAEGRIEAGSTEVLMLPESALVRSGDQAYAWRQADQRPDKVAGNAVGETVANAAGKSAGKILDKAVLVLGARDARSGNWEVRSGLASGDLVLRNPGANLKDGQILAVQNGAATARAPSADSGK